MAFYRAVTRLLDGTPGTVIAEADSYLNLISATREALLRRKLHTAELQRSVDREHWVTLETAFRLDSPDPPSDVS